MRILLCVLSICACIEHTLTERLTIFPHHVELCTDIKCNGRLHTACGSLEPDHSCLKFQWIPVTGKVVHTLLFGHNGIRNKIAEDWGVSNMNLLHWSKNLVVLSKHFLTACRIERDDCQFLAWNNITISNSYSFSPYPPSKRWMGQVIRNWYFELGYHLYGAHGLREAMELGHNYLSFTQMIWPTTEFVGCAAARMFDGYLATCYYHPAPSMNLSDFRYGRACQHCPKTRRTCSRDFQRLCGIDLPIAMGGNAHYSKTAVVCSMVFTLLVLLVHNSIYVIS